MANRPNKGYDYNRAGVAMVTLKTRQGMWLCHITPETFSLTALGRVVQEALGDIRSFYEQCRIGQYQIMPDHLHAMVHVVRDLPEGVTVQRVFRGFKLGVNRSCQEKFGQDTGQVFEKGLYDSLIFDRDQLEREVAYIRDNVRRYRLRKSHPDLLHKVQQVMALPEGLALQGVGNRSLLDHPRRVRVQFSRSMTEEQWQEAQERLAWCLEQGYVFVSAFISPYEQRLLAEVVARGGRAIRLSHEYFSERYKPAGKRFDMCCEGRLLEVSVAGAFARYAKLDRAACLKLNAVAADIATTEWYCDHGVDRNEEGKRGARPKGRLGEGGGKHEVDRRRG